MRKTVALAVVIIIVLTTFTGCDRRIEINERVIVHAIGIDEADEGYEISIQIFAPSGTGVDTPIDTSKPNMKVVSKKGKTIMECLNECELILGQKIFLGLAEFVILGESMYERNLSKELEWVVKHSESNLGLVIAYSETSAKDILNVPLNEGTTSVETLYEVVTYSIKYGAAAKSDLLTVVNRLDDPMGSGIIPVLSIVQEEGGDSQGGNSSDGGTQDESSQGESSQEDSSQGGEGSSDSGSSSEHEQSTPHLEIKKTAILKDKKVAGFVNRDEISGILWLTNKIDKIRINVEFESGVKALDFENKKTKIRIINKKDKMIFSVDIVSEVSLMNFYSDKEKSQIREKCEEAIMKRCEMASKKVLEEINADGMDVAKYTKFYQPYIYRKYEKDFQTLLEALEVDVSVKCEIVN